MWGVEVGITPRRMKRWHDRPRHTLQRSEARLSARCNGLSVRSLSAVLAECLRARAAAGQKCGLSDPSHASTILPVFASVRATVIPNTCFKMRTDASVTIRPLIVTPAQRVIARKFTRGCNYRSDIVCALPNRCLRSTRLGMGMGARPRYRCHHGCRRGRGDYCASAASCYVGLPGLCASGLPRLCAAGLRARLLLGVPTGLRWCGQARRLYRPAGASLSRLCRTSLNHIRDGHVARTLHFRRRRTRRSRSPAWQA